MTELNEIKDTCQEPIDKLRQMQIGKFQIKMIVIQVRFFGWRAFPDLAKRLGALTNGDGHV